jgi:hypothetical protein
MNPKNRQYFEATIQQLRETMLAHRKDLAVLGDLRVELEHRRSRGARQLLREIEGLVSGEVPRPTRPPRAAKPEDQTTLFDRRDKGKG